MRTFQLIKLNLIKQTRRRSFALILLISVFLGWLCVPAANDSYEIFYMDGVRGIYNSAWLGTIASMLSTILLWLPGFYLLRSQITEDRQQKIGQILAATPVTKFQYILSKFFSNFVVLSVLELLFLASLMVMQMIRGESRFLSVLDYLQPFLFVTVPYLFLLAAFTILFDVIGCLKGAFGNVLIFIFWVTMTSLSVAVPGKIFDVFAIGKLLSAMTTGASQAFSYVSSESGSFGFYPHTNPTPTFVWSGMTWEKSFLLSRLLWVGIAFFICAFSALVFDRFKRNVSEKEASKAEGHKETVKKQASSFQPLPPVLIRKSVSVFSLLKGEIKILTAGLSKGWHVTYLATILLAWILPLKQVRWISVILLILMPVWSKAGCDRKMFGTKALLIASGQQGKKWWACWMDEILLSLLLSSGVIVRYFLMGKMLQGIGWFVGTVFIPTLALFLGTICESQRLFEAVFIVWFYLGCINNMGKLDFLGIAENNTVFYLVLTVVLLIIGRLAFSTTNNQTSKCSS